MSKIASENRIHQANCDAAELTRQVAMNGTPTQATAKAADIAFMRTALASALANNCSPSVFVQALRELGTGGI